MIYVLLSLYSFVVEKECELYTYCFHCIHSLQKGNVNDTHVYCVDFFYRKEE